MSRYVLESANEDAGADANPALTTYHVNDSLTAPSQVAAQLIAFHQYMSPGAGCYIRGVQRGLDAPGPTMPVPFPVGDYAALVAADADIVAMGSYGVSYGSGALAPIGVGIVLQKRSTTPGRTGRGRLTTPWLRASAVSAVGVAVNANVNFLITGWSLYLDGVSTPAFDLSPYIWPSMSPIVAVTGSARLGKVRTRSA